MRLRWHLVTLLFAAIFTGVYWSWPRGPVWMIENQSLARFAGANADRGEWYTLVSDQDKTNWRIETRNGSDSSIIRTLRLAVPAIKGQTQFLRSKFDPAVDAPLVFVDYWSERQADGGLKTEERAWLLDNNTGQLLRQEPFIQFAMGSLAQYRNRLALAEKDQIRLIEGQEGRVRTIPYKYPTNLTFSPDGRWLVFSDLEYQLRILNWETGKLVQPAGFSKKVYSLKFLSNDLLVVSSLALAGQEVSRWKWDGERFHAVSPGIVLRSNLWPLFCKLDANGLLHVSTYYGEDWPLRWKPFFTWLQEHKFPIEKWYPLEIGSHWHVLDEQDRLIGEYFEPLTSSRSKINNQFAVEVRADEKASTTTITLWNVSPVWPNALALGMMVYLLIYVMVRCRASVASGP